MFSFLNISNYNKKYIKCSNYFSNTKNTSNNIDNTKKYLPKDIVQFYIIPYLDKGIDITNILLIYKKNEPIDLNKLKINLVNPIFENNNNFLENYLNHNNYNNLFFKYPNLYKNITYLKITTISGNFITDDILLNFYNLETLIIFYNNRITDKTFLYLKHLKHVFLFTNDKITNKGLLYRPFLKYVSLCNNTKITNDGIKFLSNAEVIHLPLNNNITSKNFKYLKNVEEIYIPCINKCINNCIINLKYITQMKNLKYILIDDKYKYVENKKILKNKRILEKLNIKIIYIDINKIIKNLKKMEIMKPKFKQTNFIHKIHYKYKKY